MPSMPDGFPSLSELKTDKFDYSTNRGKVTVTADLEDPVRLLGEGMTLHDVQMTFKYNKNIPGGRWRFNAEGEFIIKLSYMYALIGPLPNIKVGHEYCDNGEIYKRLELILFSSSLADLILLILQI